MLWDSWVHILWAPRPRLERSSWAAIKTWCSQKESMDPSTRLQGWKPGLPFTVNITVGRCVSWGSPERQKQPDVNRQEEIYSKWSTCVYAEGWQVLNLMGRPAGWGQREEAHVRRKGSLLGSWEEPAAERATGTLLADPLLAQGDASVLVFSGLQLIGWGSPSTMEGNLLCSKPTDLNVNLIQKHPHRNIQNNVCQISGHYGPAKLTHKSNRRKEVNLPGPWCSHL